MPTGNALYAKWQIASSPTPGTVPLYHAWGQRAQGQDFTLSIRCAKGSPSRAEGSFPKEKKAPETSLITCALAPATPSGLTWVQELESLFILFDERRRFKCTAAGDLVPRL